MPKTHNVTVPITVPDGLEIDLCHALNQLISIGLSDAADTIDDDTLDECEDARAVCELTIHAPFIDHEGESIAAEILMDPLTFIKLPPKQEQS